MGNKSNAKELMKSAGVPVVPGSEGSIKGFKDAEKIAEKIGYPIMLKAAAGGGGKGIRIVNFPEELESSYNLVKQEAKLSFNDDEVYIEKFIKNPRHVEIQILADEHGNVIHLGERDCTVQRKNQKVIEETPSTAIDEKLRNKMGDAAIKAAKVSGYTSCGTIEFLVDSDKNFYFMEMNTRIQVEHPITEMRTGIDIVKNQIKIAAGEELKIKQKNVEFRGHAIECRINAENPNKKFMPCPGTITGLHLPGGNGIRIDSSIYEGYTIPPTYDSMIAKIITHGDTRNEAISKMKRALEETVIEGVDTNIDFLFEIIKNPNFIRGNYDTSFIEKEILRKNDK
jgi:acetyl-CoA carboxylase biotin carboxylase subunit